MWQSILTLILVIYDDVWILHVWYSKKSKKNWKILRIFSKPKNYGRRICSLCLAALAKRVVRKNLACKSYTIFPCPSHTDCDFLDPSPVTGYDFTWRTLTPTLAKTTNINVKWRNRSCHKSELGMDNANRQPKATRRTVNAQPIRVHTLKGPSTYYGVTWKGGPSNDDICL